MTMDNLHALPPNEVFYRRFEDDALPLSEADIPLRPENRRKTDKAFVYVFIASIIILVMSNRDLNGDYPIWDALYVSKRFLVCIILFFINIPLLIYTLLHADISRLKLTGHREGDYISDEDVAVQIDESTIETFAWRVTLASFIALGLTLGMAALFRYATSFVVWFILIASWTYFFIVTVYLWMAINNIVIQIMFTVVTVVLLLVMVFMKDKVRLVTMLFREGTKASFDMQMIFSVPVVAMFLLLVVAGIYVTVTVFMTTAGAEHADSTHVSDDFLVVVLILNSVIAFWVAQFICGVQYMIVSGAVTKWYFTRNKDFLGDPVYISCYNTFRYHLGTAALGSLIITMVATVRAMIRILLHNSRCRVIGDCCMRYVDRFVRFFTKNAYIVTAMHGTPFVQSGKQAVKLLTLNICNTITINSIGDFVLTMSYVLVTVVSGLIAYLLLPSVQHQTMYLCIGFVMGVSVICCFAILGTFETAFSTMFLCVCQDFVINNGADKPYSMTRNLMEFLDESKKVFAKKIEKKGLPTI